MATVVTLSVLAKNRTVSKGNTAVDQGYQAGLIREVLPVKSGGKWIATNKLPAATQALVNAQVVIAKTPLGPEIDNIYVADTVAEVITAING